MSSHRAHGTVHRQEATQVEEASPDTTTAQTPPPSQQPAQTQRTKTGCQNCRARHLKCDEERPSCERCKKAGIECVRGYNIRFRHGANPSVPSVQCTGNGQAKTDYDFSQDQTWLKTARTLTFLDETQELINIYDHNPDEENPQPTPFRWPEASRSSRLATNASPRSFLERTQPAQTPVATESPGTLPPIAELSSFVWPPIDGTFPRAERYTQPSESPARQAFLDRPATEETSEFSLMTKRRRLTFESSYPGSNESDSPQAQRDAWHANWTPNTTLEDIASSASFNTGLNGQETTVSQSLSRIYLSTPIWPLQDKEEAILLRHFVEHLARNFDLTDPRKHFRSVVPQRAAKCPTLMNAIFALSARHLSRVGQYDPLISNKYHQECLKLLIPMLDDHDAILDENLLASTIILRHLEEFEVPISGSIPFDQHSHLLGAQAFIAAQERAAIGGGLRQAAFWVGLRQEVYVAFVNQRPVLPALEHCNIDRSFDAAEDHIWACRMVVLCADVIRFCFSDAPHTITTYKYLEEQVHQWHARKPLTFTPIYHREVPPNNNSNSSDSMQIFPELWFIGDEYTTGLQHYHLSRILLASHNPSIPRLGPGRAAALKAMDDEIRQHVRILCGMCKSNVSTAPCFVYASMAVTMAGEKFTRREEQEALVGILLECERNAWPVGMSVVNLKAAWGWSDA